MVDTGIVAESLQLHTATRRRGLEIIEAVVDDPTISQTIDGASTLEVTVADPRRRLVRSGILGEKIWASFAGLHFEVVAVTKSGDRFALTFEDTIVTALRSRTGKLSIKPGTLTRRQFAVKLCREAKVDYAIDPAKRRPVQRALQRSVGERSSSLEVLREVADDVNWRCFSDGRRLVMGSDDWLFDRHKPRVVREHRGAVQDIDFDLDTGKRASSATMTVDVAAWALPPGSLVQVRDLGPADGRWLVSSYTRTVTSPRGTVELVRSRHALPEPKRERTASAGEAGDPDYLPGQAGAPGGGKASNAAREKMVSWALAQKGKPYVWGASGPGSFDCSGLVQEATRAAGHTLPQPSASQWAAVQAAGKTMSVADAIKTRGALLFIQTASVKHVAISLGNGSTIEAKGSAYGVGVFTAYAPQYTGAGWWV